MGLLRFACFLMAAASANPLLAAAPPPACADSRAALDAAVAKTMAQGSPGMLVLAVDQGRPLFARAYGFADVEHAVPLRADSVFNLASVTKQFTAAAILRLTEQGKLRLDDPLSKHVPEFAAAGRVTIYQLLVQTSGIPDYAEDPAGSATKSVAKTPSEMLDWIVRLTPVLQFSPGSKWAYSNSNYVLLGLIAERVSKRSLGELFESLLFRPAGMISTAMDDPSDIVRNRVRGYRRSKSSPTGFANAQWISPTIPWAAGGLRTTGDDLIRWSEALFGGRIVKPESLARLVAPGRLGDGRTTKLGMPLDWQKGLNSDYGMGVFVTPTAHGMRIWHSGDIDGFQTWLARYPASGVTIALMINSQSADLDKEAIESAVFALRKHGCP